MTLTIGPGTYRIQRGPNAGRGTVTLVGSDLAFRNTSSEQCNEIGTYGWTISGGSLTFDVSAEGDPCAAVRLLAGQTYTREAP